MLKKILILLCLSISLFGNTQNLEEIGFIDDITINSREFDSLEQRKIEFYPEDLENGKVVIQGLLEPLNDNQNIEDIFVEITTNGGKSWQKASGHEDWSYSFEPIFGQVYEFSLRLAQKTTIDNTNKTNESITIADEFTIAGFTLRPSVNIQHNNGKLSGSGKIFIPWLQNLDLDPNLDVNFENLSFNENIITEGIIEYQEAFNISIADISLNVDSMTFSPNIENNKIVGSINFLDNDFLSSIDSIPFDALSFNLQGIKGDIEYKDVKKLDIWAEQNVSLDFYSFKLNLSYNLINGFSSKIVDLNAQLNFGNFLNSTKKSLEFAKDSLGKKIDGVYQWSHNKKTELIANSSLELSSIVGKLDLSDLMNPKIVFDANANLSSMSNTFSSLDSIVIKDASISKYGFFTSIDATIPDINIWSEENVKLRFLDKTKLNLVVDSRGFDIGITSSNMQLDFGNLLQNAKASITPIVSDIEGDIQTVYSWTLDSSKQLRDDINLTLKQMYGEIDLSSLSNPKIILNANADLKNLGGIFSTITSASIEDAEISKNGLNIGLGILLNDLDIWKDKEVKLVFLGDEIPTARLSINSTGSYDIGFDNFDAKIDFGTLIPETQAILKSMKDKKSMYNLVLDSADDLKLIDDKVKLQDFVSTFDLSDLKNPTISFDTKALLSGFDNLLPNMNELNIINAKISKKGFSASASLELSGIDIWKERDVKLAFDSNPKIDIKVSNGVEFGLDISGAKLKFGELLNGAIANLTKLENEVENETVNIYEWSLEGKKNIVSSSKAKLSQLSGKVDFIDLSNPKIILNSQLDLSSYKNGFSKINSAIINNAIVSKNGFKASTSIDMENLDIWKEKNVKLLFNQNPTLEFELTNNSFDIGFSNIDGNLDFGDLLGGALASIKKSQELVEDIYNDSQEIVESSRVFTWDLEGTYPLYKQQMILDTLGGTLDFSSLSNPKISLNANAQIDSYSDIFKYVRAASISNAIISKTGFEGSFSAQIDDIPVYVEKNVKIVFDKENYPTFNLAINSSGLKVGVKNLHGDIDFGTLIKDARTEIQTLSDGVLSWSLQTQEKTLAQTEILLKHLEGTLSLEDLKDPKLLINGKVNLSSYISWLNTFGDIDLIDANISKSGFNASLSANMESIDIWSEKRVKLIFNNAVTPEFKFGYDNSGLIFGIKNINGSIDFGDLLEGEIVSLQNTYKKVNTFVGEGKRGLSETKKTGLSKIEKIPQDAKNIINEGVFSWSLSNTYNLISDSNGVARAEAISGSINLNELINPVITFDAIADFTNYNMSLPASVSVDSIKIDDATISKNGIDWNLILEGINAQYVIYDMGSPTTQGTLDTDDVSLVLNDANATVGSSGVSIGSAAGTLNFGLLFKNSVNPIEILYSSEGYTFSTEQTLSFTYEGNSLELSGISGTISKVGSEYSVSFDGNAAVQVDILKSLGIDDVAFSGFDISKTGFKGTISSSWSEAKEYAILNNKAKISLSSIGVSIDTSKQIPISISDIGGYLDLSAIFDSTQEQMAHLGLSYANKTLSYSAPYNMSISKFLFKDLSGSLSLEDESLNLGLNGKFGYEGIDSLNVALSNFVINSSGLQGDILYNPTRPIDTFISGLKLKSASVGFYDNISGSFGLLYNKSNFLGSTKTFDLSLDSTLDENGINSISATSNAKEFTIPNFAQFNFNKFGISPSFDSDFYLSLGGNLKAINEVVKFGNNIDFSGLKISSNGVSIDGLSANLPNVSGANIDLGGIPLSLNNASIGFESSKFFIDVDGSLSLGITKATGGVKLYSDGKYTVDEIGVLINLPALFFGGTIAWGSDDLYGTYFGTKQPLQLRLADVITAKGEFKIGEKSGTSYWMAKASGGLGASGIPMGPINAYTLGGGVAYNMTYSNGQYLPSTSGGVVVSLSSILGTPDLGFTWHGNFDLTVDIGSKQITLSGKNYILSPKSSPDENLMVSGEITMGSSPTVLHVKINRANIMYQKIGLIGKADILFDPSEKHVYIGTSNEVSGFNVSSPLGPIELTIFDIGPKGYFMVDTRRLAFGLSYDMDKKLELDIWGPNPYIRLKLYLGADGLIQYNPFYMDLGVEADASLTAGYGSVWSGTLGAGLKIRLRTPSPTYMYVKAYVKIPYYGRASFSTYIGKKPKSTSGQKQKLVLLSGTYANTDVPILPKLQIMTAFRNDGVIVESQENNRAINYKLELENIKLIDNHNNKEIELRSSQIEETVRQYLPQRPLSRNRLYTLKGRATLYDIREDGTKRYLVSEDIKNKFRTQEEYKIKFDELIDHVEPRNFQGNLRDTLRIKMFYKKDIYDILKKNQDWVINHLRAYTVELVDDKYQNVAGQVSLVQRPDNELSYLSFVPDEPLKAEFYCINEITGERRKTHISDIHGNYYNPFNNFKLLGEPYEEQNSESGTSVDSTTQVSKSKSIRRERNIIKSLNDREPVVTCHTKSDYTIMIKDRGTSGIVYSSKFGIENESVQTADPARFEDMHHTITPSVKLSRHERYLNKYKLIIDDGLEQIYAHHGVISAKLTYKVKSNGRVLAVQAQYGAENSGNSTFTPGLDNIEDRVVNSTRMTNYSKEVFYDTTLGAFSNIENLQITYYIDGESTGISKDVEIKTIETYDTENSSIVSNDSLFEANESFNPMQSVDDIIFGGNPSGLGSSPLGGNIVNPGLNGQLNGLNLGGIR